ncbi:MAG: GNAT family N-acetyltransferase [Chloroflexota bacterium]|nr:MAG: GNAT family N-acetyltransferase [Chloroflexota bacterium]
MKNNLVDGYRSRPAKMDDLEAAVGMFNLESKHTIGVEKFFLQDVMLDWQMPGFDLATDTQIVLTADGSIAGFCGVWDLTPHTVVECWGCIHPAHAGIGLGSYLLAWAENRAHKALPKAPPESQVTMNCSSICLNQTAQDLFRQAGMQPVRYWLHMVIDLDAQPPKPLFPPGIEVRNLVVGQDEWELTKAAIESFRDHWGFVERPLEDEHERWMHLVLKNEDFDPSLCYLAWDGDQLAGLCVCWSKSYEDPEMGWVEELAVRRPWRKRGIGLALLHHAFRDFYRRGNPRVGLGVDAQNLTGALRIYEKAGMHPIPGRRFVTYEKELRPGLDLRTR